MLCEVPVPQGYKQSQTHSGVALYNGVYYLTTSPYPSLSQPLWLLYVKAAIRKLSLGLFFKTFEAEEWENPCLYVEKERRSHFPYKFELMQSSPLMPTPSPYYGLPAYNSDPDLFVENDTIHVLNRIVYRTHQGSGDGRYKFIVRLYHICGLIDEKRFKHLSTELLLESDRNLASPSLFYYQGNYCLTELETYSYNDGLSFTGLFIARSSTINGLKQTLNWDKVVVDSQKMLPWHMSVFQYDGKVFAIVACVEAGVKQRCWQMLGEFNDDLTYLKIFKTPLTDYKSYRGSALVDENGEFVLYNTTVHERIKSSYSVDGRDVIMAHKSFSELLLQLRRKEQEDE